ncbi:hypothetical protein ACU686_09845 [Yinghuangia aomiensis]
MPGPGTWPPTAAPTRACCTCTISATSRPAPTPRTPASPASPPSTAPNSNSSTPWTSACTSPDGPRHTPGELARLLPGDDPNRTTEALRLAKTAGLDDAAADLLITTAWHKWAHSAYWLTVLRNAAIHAGRLVVVSDHDQHLATRLLRLRDAPPVIPNGVDTHAFRPQRLDDVQRLEHLRHWLVTDPRGWAPDSAPGSIRYTDSDLRRLHTPDGRLRPLLLW